MKHSKLAYGEALFLLAVEEQKEEEYYSELLEISELIAENSEYKDLLTSRSIPLSERLSVIDETFGGYMSEHVVSFLKLLCENGKIQYLSECIAEYSELFMNMLNKSKAVVYSAVELNCEQKASIVSKLEKMSGKRITPEYIIDTALIGGLKIEFDGKCYDGSIKSRLRNVKDVILG